MRLVIKRWTDLQPGELACHVPGTPPLPPDLTYAQEFETADAIAILRAAGFTTEILEIE